VTNEELQIKFKERFPDFAESCIIDKGHIVAEIPLEHMELTLTTLKDDSEFDFKMYMDFTVVDWMERKPRFDLVYHLYSVEKNHRIRIKVGITESQSAPTMSGLWPVADWHEREMFDLYGVKFSGHPNLKRILLYDSFKGHPLRKDYPVTKRQPRIESTFPTRDSQYQEKDLKIHRGD
jgi:NADH-quinone oxidoreductase subunit C